MSEHQMFAFVHYRIITLLVGEIEREEWSQYNLLKILAMLKMGDLEPCQDYFTRFDTVQKVSPKVTQN